MEENMSMKKALPELNFRDLILEILSHWRGIILAACIGIVIFGAIGFVISRKEASRTKADPVSEIAEKYTVESLKKELGPEEQTAVQDALLNQDLLLKNDEFISISPLFQIDSAKAPMTKVTVKFLKTADNEAYGVATEYKGIMDSAAMREYIANKCDIPGDLTDLVVMDDCASAIMSFQFYNTSEEECEKMADAFLEYLDQKVESNQKAMKKHTYEVIDRTFSTGNAPGIAKAQNDTYEDSSNYSKRITASLKEFSLEEIYYYKLLLLEKYNDEKMIEDSGIEYYEVKQKQKLEAEKNGENQADIAEREARTESPVKRVIKMSLLGFVIAVFIYVVIVGYKYALSAVFTDADDFAEIYGVKSFGRIYREEGPNFPLDRAIRKARRLGRKEVSVSEAEEIISANAVSEVLAKGVKKVALIGTVKEEFAGKLSESIKNAGAEVLLLSGPSGNAEELKSLEGVQGAIFLVKTKESNYSEIWDEMELLRNREISILGGAVL